MQMYRRSGSRNHPHPRLFLSFATIEDMSSIVAKDFRRAVLLPIAMAAAASRILVSISEETKRVLSKRKTSQIKYTVENRKYENFFVLPMQNASGTKQIFTASVPNGERSACRRFICLYSGYCGHLRVFSRNIFSMTLDQDFSSVQGGI
jgi:hypothetical protein